MIIKVVKKIFSKIGTDKFKYTKCFDSSKSQLVD